MAKRRSQPRSNSHLRRVRIFVSSPGDVLEERERAEQVVRKLAKEDAFREHLSLDVIRWDDPEAKATMLATRSPQDNVNESLPRPSECEIVLAILWSRMGTPLESPRKSDGSAYLSGTEWEYEDAVRGAERDGRVVVVYRCTREAQVSLRDPRLAEKQQQLERVDAFFGRFDGPGGGATGSYTPYESVDDFASRLETDLRRWLPGFIEPKRGQGRAGVGTTRGRRAATSTSAPDAAAALTIPQAYRDWLKKQTGSLELLGLGGAQGRSLFPSAVYVPRCVR